MRRVIRTGLLEEYVLVESSDVESKTDSIPFCDRHAAEEFVKREFQNDAVAMGVIRRALIGTLSLIDPSRHDNAALLRRLAAALVSGRLHLVRRRVLVPAYAPSVVDEKGKDEKPRPPPTFVKIKVVDDATSAPVPWVKLRVMLQEGSPRELTTNADGIIDLGNVVGTSCTLASTLSGLTLDNAMHFVGTGETASGKKEPWEEAVVGKTTGPWYLGSRIAVIEGRKVKTGDTLESLAKEAKLTVPELLEFNFGTRNPNEIERYLAGCVGCRKRNERRLVFDDSDDPGIVFMPKTWDLSNVKTGQTTTLRIKPVSHTIRMDYTLDLDAENTKNDIISLESDDGSWKHEIEVSALKETREDLVELVFPLPNARGTYCLVQDPKDGEEPFAIARGLGRIDLVGEPHVEETNEDA